MAREFRNVGICLGEADGRWFSLRGVEPLGMDGSGLSWVEMIWGGPGGLEVVVARSGSGIVIISATIASRRTRHTSCEDAVRPAEDRLSLRCYRVP